LSSAERNASKAFFFQHRRDQQRRLRDWHCRRRLPASDHVRLADLDVVGYDEDRIGLGATQDLLPAAVKFEASYPEL